MTNSEYYEVPFRNGDFSRRSALAERLVDEVEDLHSPLPYLYASVARHEDVPALGRAMRAVESAEATARLAHCLGLTLSPVALPYLLELGEEFSELDVAEDVALGLDTLWPLPELCGDTLPHLAEDYRSIASELIDASDYVFRGRPFFVGDLAKHLVTMSVVSVRDRRKLVIGYEQDILASTTGVACPVSYGDLVTDSDLERVYAYVRDLAARKWERGAKYFAGHLVDPGGAGWGLDRTRSA